MSVDLADITIRPSAASDIPAVDALLARSYPALLSRDYPASVLVTALPLISKARPELVTCGTYYVAEADDGALLAAGGWTRKTPEGGAGTGDTGHVRHVVTHPNHVRKGLARKILTHCLSMALADGVECMVCQSTRTAVPFYRSMGFAERGAVEITLRPGVGFPAMEMIRPM